MRVLDVRGPDRAARPPRHRTMTSAPESAAAAPATPAEATAPTAAAAEPSAQAAALVRLALWTRRAAFCMLLARPPAAGAAARAALPRARR